MKAALATFSLNRFTFLSLQSFSRLLAPLRRASARQARSAATGQSWETAARAHSAPPAAARRMDPATYAAMLAEAERIAAPYRSHIAAQMAALQLDAARAADDDYADVEALLTRAGLLSD